MTAVARAAGGARLPATRPIGGARLRSARSQPSTALRRVAPGSLLAALGSPPRAPPAAPRALQPSTARRRVTPGSPSRASPAAPGLAPRAPAVHRTTRVKPATHRP
ncbi:hypothetical protein [Streptomyces sp. NPDC007110]|uniref:hypothetical protein n=1 Tax=unclassified Streptomyces TaxID=2593676 RepID=UPI0033CB4607